MRIPVEVLGATGLVGQRIVLRLANHPWFTIVRLASSDKWVGKTYSEAIDGRWIQTEPIPGLVANMVMEDCVPQESAEVVFSALGSSEASEVEPLFARAGKIVCSNASTFRLDKNVPLVIPEINADAIDIARSQDWRGKLITNTNCAVSGLAMALLPLGNAFGIRQISATTLQSISGAGLNGMAAMTIQDTVLPDIPGEAEKIERELCKVLGLDCPVSVQTWRVPVRYGHSFSIDVVTKDVVSESAFKRQLKIFNQRKLNLPGAPGNPLLYCHEQSQPNPQLLAGYNSMSVLIGGFRRIDSYRVQIRGCVNNLERGAAGAAVLNAELAVKSFLSP